MIEDIKDNILYFWRHHEDDVKVAGRQLLVLGIAIMALVYLRSIAIGLENIDYAIQDHGEKLFQVQELTMDQVSEMIPGWMGGGR